MRVTILALTLLVLVGCERKEYSAELTEPGQVADLVYMPSNHGDGIGVGMAMTSDGNIGMAVVPSHVEIPEKYAVVFQCQHGKFVIDRDQQKAKELWNRLKRDQRVTIKYQEVFIVEKVHGKWVRQYLDGLHFLDAY